MELPVTYYREKKKENHQLTSPPVNFFWDHKSPVPEQSQLRFLTLWSPRDALHIIHLYCTEYADTGCSSLFFFFFANANLRIE